MSIATVAELKAFARKADSDATGEALYQLFLDSAEAVIVDYLGYSPASAIYSHTFYGDGKVYLYLRAPIITLDTLTVDGVSKTVGNYSIDSNQIAEINGNPFGIGSIIVAGYHGGYSTVPGAIKHTELQIASLMTMEQGDNIGTSGSSFDGGNSRTFISYTNFGKYLASLAQYAVTVIPRLSK